MFEIKLVPAPQFLDFTKFLQEQPKGFNRNRRVPLVITSNIVILHRKGDQQDDEYRKRVYFIFVRIELLN